MQKKYVHSNNSNNIKKFFKQSQIIHEDKRRKTPMSNGHFLMLFFWEQFVRF